MEEIEYKEQLKKAYADFDAAKRQIIKNYLDANNPYKIGDTVKDHVGCVIIEEFQYRLWESSPEIIYVGTALNKNGQPSKREPKRGVYYSNIEK